MHPTQQPTADRSETPAAVLRHAAVYLWRYGWITDMFYRHDTDNTNGQAVMPAACIAGAIRTVVFGQPVEILSDHAPGPDHDHHTWQTAIRTVQASEQVLADAIRGRGPDDDYTSPIDIIGNWNDEDGRTVADVLILLYATADDWDAAHPLPRNDSTSSVAGGQS
jgi:hypothetical protein